MKDFSNLNQLPTEFKLLIVNGQAVLENAKETIQNKDYYFDLTSKLQLKADCKEVEKYIKLITNGKLSDKNKRALEFSIIRLQTTIDGLVKFYTR